MSINKQFQAEQVVKNYCQVLQLPSITVASIK